MTQTSTQYITTDFRITGIIGNILDHYDNVLYSLLAPFLAPLLFVKEDPITTLILVYSILPLGLISRSIGSVFFGWISDYFGRETSLYYSLFGMGCTTFIMGSIPLYASIGYWAPILFMTTKLLQGFFAAGETIGGAIYILEQTPKNNRSWVSSLYDASSISGILIASALVTILCMQDLNIFLWGWRILYWIGGTTAFIGIYLRINSTKLKINHPEPNKNSITSITSFLSLIYNNSNAFFRIIIVSGFSYMTYSMAFTLMNVYVPLTTNIEKSSVMKINTLLLIFDMLLLPFFGNLSKKWGVKNLMLSASITCFILSIPLFCVFAKGSLAITIFVRVIIVSIGVAFTAPYHAWSINQVPKSIRCTLLSIGYTVGSQLIGAPSVACSLWIYKNTQWIFAPGIYMTLIASMAIYAIIKSDNKKALSF